MKGSSNILTNNKASNNNHGIWLGAFSSNNALVNNTANSNNDYGICLEYSCTNNIISNNKASNNNHGILLESSSNNTLTNNTMSNNRYNFGIKAYNIGYIQNIDTSNKVNGESIYYWVGQQNQQIPNDAGFVGIINSANITVKDLTLTNNGYGVLIAHSKNLIIKNISAFNNGIGLIVDYSDRNILRNNTLSNNSGEGIYLYKSSNNTIVNNTVSDNERGIYLSSSTSDNFIYNNYFDNTNNARDNGNNVWNVTKTAGTNIIGGEYLGGNYWSDYAGMDTDDDGLGDTSVPYNSSGNIVSGGDWRPLVEAGEKPYSTVDVGVTSNITIANSSDLAAYLPPEYDGMNISDAVVLTVNVTDDTPENSTDEAYTDITINVGEMDIETCKVFKSGMGFLPEVDDVTALPTVDGDPAFSRDLVNNTVTIRLYVGDPLLGVIPTAEPSVFDTDEGTYPNIMGRHNGTIKPSSDIEVSRLYTYPCAGTGGHTKSIELYENETLIASGMWEGYQSDWHNITLVPEVALLKDHEYLYVLETGSYPQIIHASGKAVTGGTINCTEFVDVNGKTHTDWIPAIRLE